jgi:hypothetical protein
MTIKIELRELVMTPSNKKRSVMKNDIPNAQGEWLQMLLHEIKNYNKWVDRKNDSLSKKNDETITFYEPPIRKCYDW